MAGAMDWASVNGPGTVVVAGSALYFYMFDGEGANTRGLPRLSSLIFSEWRARAR